MNPYDCRAECINPNFSPIEYKAKIEFFIEFRISPLGPPPPFSDLVVKLDNLPRKKCQIF